MLNYDLSLESHLSLDFVETEGQSDKRRVRSSLGEEEKKCRPTEEVDESLNSFHTKTRYQMTLKVAFALILTVRRMRSYF